MIITIIMIMVMIIIMVGMMGRWLFDRRIFDIDQAIFLLTQVICMTLMASIYL